MSESHGRTATSPALPRAADHDEARRLDAVLGMLAACAGLNDEDALFSILAERAPGLIRFDRLTILLCDEDREIRRTILIREGVAREVSAGDSHPADADAIHHVLTTGTSLAGLDCLGCPMSSGGHVVGAVCFAGRPDDYTPQDRRVADSLAEFLVATLNRLARTSEMRRQTRALASALEEREAALASAAAASQQLSYVARHDALTNLPNRVLLNDRLARAIALASRHHRGLAVMFLDLDGFKQINDSLGHGTGDQVLRAVSDRLATCVRSSDTVSRHGGDEFVVLLAELEHAADAAFTATRIMAAVTAPLLAAGHEISLTASVGISVYPEGGTDAETLIKSADLAMYRARMHGPGHSLFFKAGMNEERVLRESVEKGLRRALARGEFVLHYQPIVDLESGVLIAGEALIRWRHPDHGVLPAAQFVRVAEESGLMVPIGQWALREACRQGLAWRQAGLPPIVTSVNISAVEFGRKSFVEDLSGILEETHTEGRYLGLELTETVLMPYGESTVATLQALKSLGVHLSVDNFGTGSSSLSRLSQFPIDALKVDRSFVHRLTADPVDGVIVSAVVGVARALGVRVIAEGVETAEQLAILRTRQCGRGQGYYFSHSLGADQFAGALKAGLDSSAHRSRETDRAAARRSRVPL